MKEHEFNQWFDSLCEAFPAVSKYIQDNPGMLTHWHRSLEDVRLQDALPAITELVRVGRPFPEEIPSKIRTLAWQFRFAAPTTEHRERNDCPSCADSGTHFAWVCGFAKNSKDPTWRYANVACRCGAGDRWENPRPVPGAKQRPLVRFDEASMVMTVSRHHFPQEADLALLEESNLPGSARHAAWVRGGREGRQPVVVANRTDVFDDWNDHGSV